MSTIFKILGTIAVVFVAMAINGVMLELTGSRLFGMLAIIIGFFLIRAIWKKEAAEETEQPPAAPKKANIRPEVKEKSPVRAVQEKPKTDITKSISKRADEILKMPDAEVAKRAAAPERDPVVKKTAVTPLRKAPSEVKRKPKATKPKQADPLPPPEIETSEAGGTIFVGYTVDMREIYMDALNEGYPVVRYPKKGTVVRSHRVGSTKRRGFKDADFEKAIRDLLPDSFTVLGNARLNTGRNTRPFEPDIAIIGHGKFSDIRIDVEIDEPYAGISRQVTHCEGDDVNRDLYFQDRGWIVVRFAEIQVHQNLMACLFKLVDIIDYARPTDIGEWEDTIAVSENPLKLMSNWDMVQAQKWEKQRYRESYLNHEFGLVASEPETAKRDLSEQEAEEESLVEATVNEPEAEVGTESFNGRNGHPRDSRLKFYPVEHLYTLDGVPIAAVSNVVARFFPEYDAEYWSVRNGNRDGINPETLRKRWAENGERSRNLGTQLHQDIENYYLKGSRAEGADYELFQKFLADHPDLKPYRSEWRIFDDKYMVAGTLDLVVKTATGYDMYDWKRSKKVMDRFGAPITENKWASGIGPLSHLPDTSFNRYVLQQNIYRSFLEKHYGIKIDKMYLVVLHPNHSTYYKVEVPKRKEEVKALLEAVR
jgi:hypothetical protein